MIGAESVCYYSVIIVEVRRLKEVERIAPVA